MHFLLLTYTYISGRIPSSAFGWIDVYILNPLRLIITSIIIIGVVFILRLDG